MRKVEFNHLITSPKRNIEKVEMKDLNQLKKQFPYCENIHNLSLLKAHFLDDINFTKILAISSLYSSNRKSLFKFIHPPLKIKGVKPKANNSTHVFEEWLKDPLLMRQKNNTQDKIKETIKKSTEDNDYLTTETLANLYIDQGHYKRAIQAYEILCLKYPKKSGFFANQIQNLKNKLK